MCVACVVVAVWFVVCLFVFECFAIVGYVWFMCCVMCVCLLSLFVYLFVFDGCVVCACLGAVFWCV